MRCPDCSYPFATWKKCDNCGRDVSNQPFGCTMFFAAIFVGVVALVIIAPKKDLASAPEGSNVEPPPKVVPVAQRSPRMNEVVEQKPSQSGDAAAFARADAKLNVAYQNAMTRLDLHRQEQLRNEQRSWIRQRDEAVSRNPIEAIPIKLKMTLIRTREIEQYR